MLWEAYGHFDVGAMEARKVWHYLDMLQAQRAVWLTDLTLAFNGGEGLQKRVRSLTEAFAPDITAEPSENELRSLVETVSSVSPGQGLKMRKHLEYLAFCKKVGLEA